MEDAAPSIMLATEGYDKSEPVNIDMGCNSRMGSRGGCWMLEGLEKKKGWRAKVKFEGGLKTLVTGWMGRWAHEKMGVGEQDMVQGLYISLFSCFQSSGASALPHTTFIRDRETIP